MQVQALRKLVHERVPKILADNFLCKPICDCWFCFHPVFRNSLNKRYSSDEKQNRKKGHISNVHHIDFIRCFMCLKRIKKHDIVVYSGFHFPCSKHFHGIVSDSWVLAVTYFSQVLFAT